jgi:hypothetical protein
MVHVFGTQISGVFEPTLLVKCFYFAELEIRILIA